MRRWLTPDNLPASRTVERAFFLPADPVILALVGGALTELINPDNWEQYGTATPEDTAEYFQAIIEEFYS